MESFHFNLLSSLRNHLFPPLCTYCNKDGAYVCDACRKKMLWIDPYYACRMCGAPFGRFTCTSCRHDSELSGVICAVGGCEISLKIIKTYKNGPEINLAPFIAASIVSTLDLAQIEGVLKLDLDHIDCISYIPARFESLIKRGFDHMEVVAKICSKLLDIPYVSSLEIVHASDQRSLGQEERFENMIDSMRVVEDVSGMNILLLDDVVTTGATMLCAIKVLETSGAHDILPAAFCRIW